MAIFDVLKTAAKVAQEAGKIELYDQIHEVSEKLLDQQKRLFELEEENKNLKEKLKIKGSLIPEGNFYWLIEDEKKDGPFCTKCWDSDGKLLRLHGQGPSGGLKCPNCNVYARHGQAQTFNPINHWKNSAL